MSEKRKKRRKIGLIVFLSVLFFLSVVFLFGITLFQVKDVIVEGNELYRDEAIKELVLDKKYSWNSLYVYFRFRFAGKETVPFVDEMDVTLEKPDTIKVVVYEKGLIGYALRETDGSYIYFDKDGFVIDISEEPAKSVPEICGVNAYGADVRDKLEIPEKTLRSLLTLTQDLSKNGLSADRITLADGARIVLTFGDIEADLGKDEHLTEKVSRLAKILPQLSGKRGRLDLSTWTEETTDIIFSAQ
ncbi:MAG: cell division protein FtsQ/DivIB [Lachnospiraceae bacterium]|nr:cell division protein FtsQ/DivIB [Lachnospiraceae bacterium]